MPARARPVNVAPLSDDAIAATIDNRIRLLCCVSALLGIVMKALISTITSSTFPSKSEVDAILAKGNFTPATTLFEICFKTAGFLLFQLYEIIPGYIFTASSVAFPACFIAPSFLRDFFAKGATFTKKVIAFIFIVLVWMQLGIFVRKVPLLPDEESTRKILLPSHNAAIEAAAIILAVRASTNCFLILMLSFNAWVWLLLTQTILRGFYYAMQLLDAKDD
jgi:hypothetical protein